MRRLSSHREKPRLQIVMETPGQFGAALARVGEEDFDGFAGIWVITRGPTLDASRRYSRSLLCAWRMHSFLHGHKCHAGR
jgi:hypothetical protein